MKRFTAGNTLLATAALLVSLLIALVLLNRSDHQGLTDSSPGFLTIQFGRSIWTQTGEDCQPYPDSVNLGEIAEALAARSVSAVGTVVVSRTLESSRLCFGQYAQHASWADLAELRDDYDWSFVSAGQNYENMTLLTREQQLDESCGSLTAFTSHGHSRATGLFAYPNNKYTREIQVDVVATCFAYGRSYAQVATRHSTGFPFIQKTKSVSGGSCSNPSLPCATVPVKNDRVYTSPESVIDLIRTSPGEWATVQWYRLVKDKSSGTPYQWDCTSSEPRDHWTSHGEIYCFNDFLSVVDAVPDDVIVTDPLSVAQAWGRTLP